MNELKAIIEDAFENRDSISPSSAPDEVRDAVAQAIDLLNTGKARVAEKIAGEWKIKHRIVHADNGAAFVEGELAVHIEPLLSWMAANGTAA